MVLPKRKKEVRNGRINEMGCFSNDLKEKCFRSFSFFQPFDKVKQENGHPKGHK